MSPTPPFPRFSCSGGSSAPRPAGFTLLEVCLAVFIALLIVGMAVPSLSGVLKANAADAAFEQFNHLVQEARARSLEQRRPHVLLWTQEGVTMQADGAQGEEDALHLTLGKDDSITLDLTAAMVEKPQPVWTFWPSGTCEPATVRFAGKSGKWTAVYNPFTAQPEVSHE